MQRLLAVLLVLLGLIGLVLGRLGETTWAPATETTASVELSDPGPAVVIDPGVLYVGAMEGTMTIEADADVSVITADNSDIDAYLEDTAYTRITGASDWTTLSTKAVHPEGETEISSPTDSDLWRTVDTGASPYTLDVADFAAQEHGENEQAYRAILVVTDGAAPAADAISITWPVEDENEWVPFAYAGGAAIAVVGLVLLVVSIGGRRRDEDEQLEDADVDENAADEGPADVADADRAASEEIDADEPAADVTAADAAAADDAAGTAMSPVAEQASASDETEVLDPVDDEGPVEDEGTHASSDAAAAPAAAVDDTEVLDPVDGDTDAWGLGEHGTPGEHDAPGEHGTSGPAGEHGTSGEDATGSEDQR